MSIGKSLGFMFSDPKWGQKMIMFTLMSFACVFLVGIPFLIGYMVLTVKYVAEGKGKLPEWNGNWEKLLMSGFQALLVVALLIITGGVTAAFGSSALNALWNLIFLLVVPLALIKAAVSDELEEIFDFAWYADFLSRNLVNVVLVAAMQIAFFVVAVTGALGLIVGIFFTTFYAMVGQAYLLGSLYRVGSGATVAPKTSGDVPVRDV